MISDDDTGEARPFMHVPATVEELKPAEKVELLLLAVAFIKAYYPEMQPYYASMSGEGPTLTGHPDMDEAAQALKMHEEAKLKGHKELADLMPDELRRLLARAFRRVSGLSVPQLKKQGNRLRIEDRRARKAQEEATKQAAE